MSAFPATTSSTGVLQLVDEPTSYGFEPVHCCVMCGAGDAAVLGRRLNGRQGLRPRRRPGVTVTVRRCRSCGLIYADPRPVPMSLAQHYGGPPETYWPSGYFTPTTDYFDEQIATFKRLWGRSVVPRALDVGAGLGKALRSLERSGFDAFGFEPSSTFRDGALAAGLDPERLQLASIEDADLPADQFDLVTFGAVLEHLHDPAAALTRALGWAAPGGLIHVEVPSAEWLIARMVNRVYRFQGLDFVGNLSPMHPPYHLYEFTLTSFQRYSDRAGCTLAEHRRYTCQTFLPAPAGFIAGRVMAATGTGMQLEVWLRKPGTASRRPLADREQMGHHARERPGSASSSKEAS
jgi:SAM-dependent methyltransferase